MNPVTRTTNTHVKAAIDDLCNAGVDTENLMAFVHAMALGIAFTIGSMRNSNPESISADMLDKLIDEVALEMKRAAHHASTFEPPKPN